MGHWQTPRVAAAFPEPSEHQAGTLALHLLPGAGALLRARLDACADDAAVVVTRSGVDGARVSVRPTDTCRHALAAGGAAADPMVGAKLTFKGPAGGADIVEALSVHRELLFPAATDTAPLSFLLHSCNNPFVPPSDSGQQRYGIEPATETTYQLFRGRAEGRLRVEGAWPAVPSFALGVGDQIYADPDANETVLAANGKPGSSLALVNDLRSNQLRVGIADAPRVFQEIYASTFGLHGLREGYASVPHLLMWDDHEISDGFGSQGWEPKPEDRASDSSVGGRYYRHARAAFLDWQDLRNPVDGVVGKRNARPTTGSLGFSWRWNDRVQGVMLDTRSLRQTTPDTHTAAPRVEIERLRDALAAFRDQNHGRPAVFVVGLGVPLSLVPANTLGEPLLRRFSSSLSEIQEDKRDGWEQAPEDMMAIVSMLAQTHALEPNHLLVVASGDVHQSGTYAFYAEDAPEGAAPFAYEIVSSGIAEYLGHEKRCISEQGQQVREELSYRGVGPGAKVLGASVSPRGYVGGSPLFAELGLTFPPTDDAAPALSVRFFGGRTGASDYSCECGKKPDSHEANGAIAADLASGKDVVVTDGSGKIFDPGTPKNPPTVRCARGSGLLPTVTRTARGPRAWLGLDVKCWDVNRRKEMTLVRAGAGGAK